MEAPGSRGRCRTGVIGGDGVSVCDPTWSRNKERSVKTPLFDHLWTKIAERDSLARAVTEQKLRELKTIGTAIALHGSSRIRVTAVDGVSV